MINARSILEKGEGDGRRGSPEVGISLSAATLQAGQK